MKKLTRKTIFAVCCTLILLFSAPAWAQDLLPEGFVMEETFQPGYGPYVGTVLLVQGEVVILHAGETVGYRAEKNLPLYKGDTVVSRPRGRMQFKLNDESVITLASNTKLVLTRSLYEPKKKIRSSFLRLSFGKVRFWVNKLATFKRSQFRVKSVTAVVGVRGSEWLQEVAIVTKSEPRYVESITTGPGTTMSVGFDPALKKDPIDVPAFTKLTLEEGLVKSELINPEIWHQLQKGYRIPEVKVPEIALQRKRKVVRKVVVKDSDKVPPGASGETGIPEGSTQFEHDVKGQETNEMITDFPDIWETFRQEQRQDLLTWTLPDFPGTPE